MPETFFFYTQCKHENTSKCMSHTECLRLGSIPANCHAFCVIVTQNNTLSRMISKCHAFSNFTCDFFQMTKKPQTLLESLL